MKKPLLAILLLLLLGGATQPIAPGPVLVCPDLRPVGCQPADIGRERLHDPTLFVRHVRVEPNAMPLTRPPMIWLVALASAEVRWNGVVIGRNGRPGPDRSSEIPGRYVSTFVVPTRLVRPGDNLLELRMSASHLWLPVRTPFHYLEVGLYETPRLPGLSDYLPALLMLGAFFAALVYFGAAARSERGARLLAIVAGAAIVQLTAEVSRAFIAYSYPWHLARVAGIALLAGIAAAAIARYAALRFAPSWQRSVTWIAILACAIAITIIPWFDLKAIAATMVGAAALIACAARGLGRGRPRATWALVAGLSFLLAILWERTLFLDRGYYLLLGAWLILLITEQVANLRRARAERDREVERAAALAERLAIAERNGEPVVALKDGSRLHRVAESDILFVRAADDYCDVILCDGRTLLVTIGLARLADSLPCRFARVHKSYLVNRAHVVSAEPRPSGGRILLLSDGSAIPVGRRYAATVGEWLTPSPSGARRRG